MAEGVVALGLVAIVIGLCLGEDWAFDAVILGLPSMLATVDLIYVLN